MPVTELYAFNLICENLLAALYGVALSVYFYVRLLFVQRFQSYFAGKDGCYARIISCDDRHT